MKRQDLERNHRRFLVLSRLHEANLRRLRSTYERLARELAQLDRQCVEEKETAARFRLRGTRSLRGQETGSSGCSLVWLQSEMAFAVRCLTGADEIDTRLRDVTKERGALIETLKEIHRERERFQERVEHYRKRARRIVWELTLASELPDTNDVEERLERVHRELAR